MIRQRLTMTLCGAAVLTAGTVTPARGQINSRIAPVPCTEAPRLLIVTPRADGGLRARQTGEAQLRSRLGTVLSSRDVCVIPKPDSDAILTQSKFPTDTALSVIDALALGQPLRADEIVLPDLRRSGETFEYSGTVILQRDQWLRDRIPPAGEAPDLSGAARLFWIQYKAVRKQLVHEQTCYRETRAGRFAEAAAAARAGIAAYPQGVIARLCLAVALQGQRQTDAYLAVVNEVRQRDSTNVRALLLAMAGYFEKSDTNRFADVASRIVSLDPTNPEVDRAITTLALWKRADIALPMIARVLRDDPENKTLLDVEYRLMYSAGNWRRAAEIAETLARDTAVVDTTFIQRIVSVYANDSQPIKVLEWLTTGTKKFPTHVAMSMRRAQQLRNMGKTQEAIDEYKRLLGLAPNTPQIRLYIAQYYDELQRPDSADAWIRRAAGLEQDRAQAANVAIGTALKQFNAANQRMRDTTQVAAAMQDFKNVIPSFAFVDSLNPTDPRAKFYWGYAAYIIGANAVSTMDAQTRLRPPVRPTCEQVKEARAWVDLANEKIAQGGRADPANAPKLFQSIQEVMFPWFEGVTRSLRCTS